MRIRYAGSDESRDLALSSGVITCPRMEWVDVEAVAAASGLRSEHALIVAREVVKHDDWQLEGAVKAAKTRAANKKAAPDPAPVADEPPAEPANEENDQ